MEAEQGDAALTISCSSSGFPQPDLSWTRTEGGEEIPSMVTPVLNGDRLNLEWNRPLMFSDSGRYSCRGENDQGDDTAMLDLFVARK